MLLCCMLRNIGMHDRRTDFVYFFSFLSYGVFGGHYVSFIISTFPFHFESGIMMQRSSTYNILQAYACINSTN